MKKTIIVMLVALLLVSSIASAGFWDKLTGNAFFSFWKKADVQAAAAPSVSSRVPVDSGTTIFNYYCGRTPINFNLTGTSCARAGTVGWVLNASESPAYATVMMQNPGRAAQVRSINVGSSATIENVRVTVIDAYADPTTFSRTYREGYPVCGAVLAIKCVGLTAAPVERMTYWSTKFGK